MRGISGVAEGMLGFQEGLGLLEVVVYEKVLFERKKVKLWNRLCFVENKTDYAACPENIVNFLIFLL